MASRKERAFQQVLEECTKEQIARTLVELCDDLGMYDALVQVEKSAASNTCSCISESALVLRPCGNAACSSTIPVGTGPLGSPDSTGGAPTCSSS